jgi:hypothetical protein
MRTKPGNDPIVIIGTLAGAGLAFTVLIASADVLVRNWPYIGILFILAMYAWIRLRQHDETGR